MVGDENAGAVSRASASPILRPFGLEHSFVGLLGFLGGIDAEDLVKEAGPGRGGESHSDREDDEQDPPRSGDGYPDKEKDERDYAPDDPVYGPFILHSVSLNDDMISRGGAFLSETVPYR